MILGISLCSLPILYRKLSPLINNAWRWIKAWKLFGYEQLCHHFKAQRQIKGCCSCARLTLPNEDRYECTICEDFEICEECFLENGQTESHRHPLVKEYLDMNVDTSQVLNARTTAEALSASFDVYSKRRCVGYRPRHNGVVGSGSESDASDYLDYHWLTYEQVGDKAFAFGAGLRKLLRSTSEVNQLPRFVGLLGAMSVKWLISDFGCLLKGMPTILFYRTTSSIHLQAVIEETSLSVLIASIHLRHIVMEALSKLSVDINVVWINDDEDLYGGSSFRPSDDPQVMHDGKSNVISAAKIVEYCWEDVETLGRSSEDCMRSLAIWQSCDIVKMLPTSGTTGSLKPKLVVVMEGSMRPQRTPTMTNTTEGGRGSPTTRGTSVVKTFSNGPSIVYSYEVMRQSHDLMLKGGRVGCFSGLGNMLPDVQLLRPTVFAATPAFCKSVTLPRFIYILCA
jgi:hypothetical protein